MKKKTEYWHEKQLKYDVRIKNTLCLQYALTESLLPYYMKFSRLSRIFNREIKVAWTISVANITWRENLVTH